MAYISERPSFHILISMIKVWKPKKGDDPTIAPANCMVITECSDISISESYKQLVGTAKLSFPRGTIVRKTITLINLHNKNMEVTAQLNESGVVEELRDKTEVMTANHFEVGQRIRIYLGYTTDPMVREKGRIGYKGNTIFDNYGVMAQYESAMRPNDIGQQDILKNYTNIMFDGYITKVGVDMPVTIECENLASGLKRVNCKKKVYLKGSVNNLFGNGKKDENLLQGTGLGLHSATREADLQLGRIETTTDMTVADLLRTFVKYGLYSFIGDDNGRPSLVIGRPYFSKIENDSLLKAYDSSRGIPIIYFDYHVPANGNSLEVMIPDPKFFAVEAKGFCIENKKEKEIHITVARNPEYDPTKGDVKGNEPYRAFNETKLSKKAKKAGLRTMSNSQTAKLDMKLYTNVQFTSRTRPVTRGNLYKEACKYLEGYNLNGIDGTLTIFGDLHLKCGQVVRLQDDRFPAKNGLYFVGDVATSFGTGGFRQTLKFPYCLGRDVDAGQEKTGLEGGVWDEDWSDAEADSSNEEVIVIPPSEEGDLNMPD